MTRSVFTNAAYNLIFQILTALIGVGVTALLFKVLEPEQFVSFSYLSVSLFMLNYTNFGVPLVTTRKLARVLSKEGKTDRKQIQVSFLANFLIGLILISILKLFELNTDISIFDSQRFYAPLYGLIVFYFIYIHIRSVADGIGSYRLSRYVKSYFYICFFMSAALTEYFNLPAWGNFSLLLFCAVLLIPKLFYQLDFSNLMDARNDVFNTLYEGLPFLQLAVITATIGYLDRFMLPFYISGAALASMLFILDMASRQALIGTAMANVTLKLFISSEKAESEIFFKGAFLVCVVFIITCLIGAYFAENAILQFLGIGAYKFSAILNLWVGFSLLVLHSIQWQWIVALSLEKSLARFLVAELLVLLPLLYILLKIDAVFYLSVLLFFRACAQIFAGDFLIGRPIKNMLSAQLFFILIFVVINTTFI